MAAGANGVRGLGSACEGAGFTEWHVATGPGRARPAPAVLKVSPDFPLWPLDFEPGFPIFEIEGKP
jgi:hypothetical protein